jgi:hypothetical protein
MKQHMACYHKEIIRQYKQQSRAICIKKSISGFADAFGLSLDTVEDDTNLAVIVSGLVGSTVVKFDEGVLGLLLVRGEVNAGAVMIEGNIDTGENLIAAL